MRWLSVLFLALFATFLLVGCDAKKLTITTVEIDSDTISDEIDIKDFDVSGLNLIVTYSDGSIKKIVVTKSMVSNPDLAKLDYMGSHSITIDYLTYKVVVNLVMTDSVTLSNLLSYYNDFVATEGGDNSYQTWLSSLTAGSSQTIIKATLSAENVLLITLSNKQTISLYGSSDTFTVSFYDFYNELIKTQTVAKGSSAVAPSPLQIQGYVFTGWSEPFTNVQGNIYVVAMYEPSNNPGTQLANVDQLNISLERLEQAQFTVDLDNVFSGQIPRQQTKQYRSLASLLYSSVVTDTSEPFDPTDYIPHTYWTNHFYHQGLYIQKEVESGYNVITSTLSSYNDHALNNLYEVNISVTTLARERADWAVDHITVMDTWVNQGIFKYLLHYDEEKDRVELYTTWKEDGQGVESYEKTYVYYNHKGEEVIENFVSQYHYKENKPIYPGVMGYYNSIAGRDFNYYIIWLDEDSNPTTNKAYRGININDEGVYEFYEGHSHMISGKQGWYTLTPGIDDGREMLYYSNMNTIDVYSKDTTSNVFKISPTYEGTFDVSLYLPSMHGVQSLLVGEGGIIKVNQDNPYTQAMLIEQNAGLMPDWYVVDNNKNNLLTGFKTSKGTFYGNQTLREDDIIFKGLEISVGNEGNRTYDYYHNYFAIAKLNIRAASVVELCSILQSYLEEIGLSYKFGNIGQLLEEYTYIYENYEEISRNISITNDVMGLTNKTYESFESIKATERFIYDYLNIKAELVVMANALGQIDFIDLPPKDDLNKITWINTEALLSGQLQMVDHLMDTKQVTGVLNRSPLLQTGKSYSLYYALKIGGKLIEIAKEVPQIYQNQTLTFKGNQTFEIPEDLGIGLYELVMFYAKVTEDGFLRISNPVSWDVTNILAYQTILSEAIFETSTQASIYASNNKLMVSVQSIDLFAPKVQFTDDANIYQQEQTIEQLLLPFDCKISDFLSFIKIKDNYDGFIKSDVSFLTKNNAPVQLDDLVTKSSYELIVTDLSDNQTKITILNVDFGFRITFMDGFETYNEVLCKEDQTILLPDNPVFTGYTFDGWFLSEEALEPFDFTIMPTKDMVFYARWHISSEEPPIGTN